MALPTAPEGSSVPSYFSISDWGHWFQNTGMDKYTNEISDYAHSKGLSFEDAAYQLYYNQSIGQKGVNTTSVSPNVGNMSPGVSTPTTSSIVDQAKQLATFTSEQNKPVIASLEAQRQPLIDRYQSLLDQIKGNQATAEQRQSIATSQEFGKRGIPLSSGIYNTALAEKLNPITQQYSNLEAQTGAGREQDLLSLAREIAGLQSGNPGQAINQSLQLGQYQQGAQSLAAQIAAQQSQQQIAQQQLTLQQQEFGLKEKQFNQDPYGIFG